MKRTNTLFLAEVAIFGALAYLLDLLAGAFSLANGGSIAISMVPIFIIAFRWGLKGGLLSGLLLGLLQIIIGKIIGVNIVQLLLDYIVAFVGLGLAGIFAKQVTNAAKAEQFKRLIVYVTLASFIGCLVRFLAHFTAGIIFSDILRQKDSLYGSFLYYITEAICYQASSSLQLLLSY